MTAVEVSSLSHRYGDRVAIDGVDFSVGAGEFFALVGPNGGGKSTAFKILSTLIVPTGGRALVLGTDVVADPHAVRRRIGVVFQAPALDRKLTAAENLRYHGYLYGLSGRALAARVTELLALVGLSERAEDRVETLSGGLKRRLEIVRALLHRPELLILDEPTTGLDPLARHEVWQYLNRLRAEQGVTILFTTHFLDEAHDCDGIALLDRGKLVLSGAPASLIRAVGGDIISVRARRPDSFHKAVEDRFHLGARLLDGEVRIERAAGHELIPDLIASFSDEIVSLTIGKPTLEDLFIARTGHKFLGEGEALA